MTKRLRSPIWWFGGKGNMVAKILPLFPPHRIYVEPFGGGASLLMAKAPAPVEVYNDLDSGLVNLFRVLRDEAKFERFRRLVELTPYSREEYNDCRTWLREHGEGEDGVERAYRFFVVARQSFSGHFAASWGYSFSLSTRGMASTCSSWLSTIEGLPAMHERLMRVQIEHSDFRTILTAYDSPDTLFYCDPPYVPATRKNGNYVHEMTESDHEEFVQRLLKLKGMVVLSGYNHGIYSPLETAGWQRIDFETACYAAARTRGTGILGEGAARSKQPRVESVWLSPNCGQPKLLLEEG